MNPRNTRHAIALRAMRITLAAAIVATLATAIAPFHAPQQAHAAKAPAQYAIIYKLHGGTQAKHQVKAVKAKGQLKTSALGKPTRKGYSFAGWYKTASYTKKASTVKGKRTKSARTVHAKWKAFTYTITYKPGGGTMPADYKSSYTTAKGVPSLPKPMREGYVFLGWYSDSKYLTHVTSIPKGYTGNKTLRARWWKRTPVAHRGYHADQPENSLAAYEAAKAAGFAEAETDVRFTADNVAILHHDATVSAYDTTLAVVNLEIASLTYEQLQTLDLAEPKAGPNGRNFTTFFEFMATCKKIGLVADVELKAGSEAQIKYLVAVADLFGMQNRVRWTSFSLMRLGYVRSVHPDASIQYMSSQDVTASQVKKAVKLAKKGDVVMLASAKRLTKDGIALCKANALPLGAWSIGDDAAARTLDPYLSVYMLDALSTGTRAAAILSTMGVKASGEPSSLQASTYPIN